MIIEKVALTKEILTEIMKIDDEFYKDDKTTLDWYLSRYNSKHIGYLIKDKDNVLGYIVAVPIKKILYKTITEGVLVNDIYINPDMFIEKSKYNYIVSYVLLPKYRHKGLGTKFIASIIKNVNKGYYCALAISKEGNAVASKYMNLKLKINDEISVYEIKF